jgi:hypothetical protein
MPHIGAVVIRGQNLMACDGHRLAVVPHIQVGQAPSFGVMNDDIDKIVAVAAVLKAPMLDFLLKEDRLQVSIGPAVVMDVRARSASEYPVSDGWERLLLPKKRGRPVPTVAINPALFGAMSEVEAAIPSSTPVEDRYVTLESWGGKLDGVVFNGHAGATYMIMPVNYKP